MKIHRGEGGGGEGGGGDGREGEGRSYLLPDSGFNFHANATQMKLIKSQHANLL